MNSVSSFPLIFGIFDIEVDVSKEYFLALSRLKKLRSHKDVCEASKNAKSGLSVEFVVRSNL